MECYYLNDSCHKVNGPAIIEYDEDGEVKIERYFLNHIEITDLLKIKEINSKSMQKEIIQEESKNKIKSRKIFIIDDF